MFELAPTPKSMGRPLRLSVLGHALAAVLLTIVGAPSLKVTKPRPRSTALVAPPAAEQPAPAPSVRTPRVVAPPREAFAWPEQKVATPAEVAAPPVLALAKAPPTWVAQPAPAPSMVEPPPRVQVGGFAAAAVLEPIAHPQLPVVVGGFSAGTSGAAGGPRRAAGVQPAGFDGTAGGARPSSGPRVIADAGFAAAGGAAPSRPRRPAEVEEPLSAGIEILDKPRPVYSEEGRRLKIEGEVVLEALFTASGEVRVQRLLRGLGHGLDQNAIEAAEHIRFRPAMRGGRSADLVATVQISFHLAY